MEWDDGVGSDGGVFAVIAMSVSSWSGDASKRPGGEIPARPFLGICIHSKRKVESRLGIWTLLISSVWIQ